MKKFADIYRAFPIADPIIGASLYVNNIVTVYSDYCRSYRFLIIHIVTDSSAKPSCQDTDDALEEITGISYIVG